MKIDIIITSALVIFLVLYFLFVENEFLEKVVYPYFEVGGLIFTNSYQVIFYLVLMVVAFSVFRHFFK